MAPIFDISKYFENVYPRDPILQKFAIVIIGRMLIDGSRVSGSWRNLVNMCATKWHAQAQSAKSKREKYGNINILACVQAHIQRLDYLSNK